MYGCTAESTRSAYFLIIAKCYNFQTWFNNDLPCLQVFIMLLNDKILCEQGWLLKIIAWQNFHQSGLHCVPKPQVFAAIVYPPLFAYLFCCIFL